ncbi:MAG: GNAT family N-acetyltransferase, partial [Lachnospiraceae bacterium]|nr:GNAT family N-acetyltransferase [Lachnospiraceae bacterium]
RRAEVDYVFAVVLKQENKLIGDINYSEEDDDTYEIGYDFNEFFWGHGYAAESCKEIIRHLFETVGARRVIAQCNDDNERSIRLLEKLGFRREGYFLEDVSFKEDENGNPIYVNSLQYAMLKREWDCN